MACSKPRRTALEDEKNCKLTYFFRDLLRDRIEFQITSKETKDIVSATHKLVNDIVQKVTSDNKWLGPFDRLRILKVGSMAERTSIEFPNEFDYLVITHQDGIEVERVCKLREGYAHIKVTDSRLQSRWGPFLFRSNYLQGSFSHDFTGKLTSFGEYALSVCRKWVRRDPLQERQSQSLLNPYYDSLVNAFMSEVEKVIRNSTGDIKCCKDTGTMCVKGDVVNHGPAFMPTFIWKPKHREDSMTIKVDITLAIEVDMLHHNIIRESDTFHTKIWHKLVQHGKYLLIPCKESKACVAGHCFRLTFTETEVELVRGLSRHHKECYKLLKYIFNSGAGYSYLPSYVFKMLVIKHDCFCREPANLAVCFKTLLASLLYHISNVKLEEQIEPSRLLRLFMPGQKFKISIPSIFIKTHNILDDKDYKFPCEQLLLSIEIMLESVEMISTQDRPDDKDLKIVNSLGTAALAYARSIVPSMKKDKGHTYYCLGNYFRQYGGRTFGSRR